MPPTPDAVESLRPQARRPPRADRSAHRPMFLHRRLGCCQHPGAPPRSRQRYAHPVASDRHSRPRADRTAAPPPLHVSCLSNDHAFSGGAQASYRCNARFDSRAASPGNQHLKSVHCGILTMTLKLPSRLFAVRPFSTNRTVHSPPERQSGGSPGKRGPFETETGTAFPVCSRPSRSAHSSAFSLSEDNRDERTSGGLGSFGSSLAMPTVAGPDHDYGGEKQSAEQQALRHVEGTTEHGSRSPSVERFAVQQRTPRSRSSVPRPRGAAGAARGVAAQAHDRAADAGVRPLQRLVSRRRARYPDLYAHVHRGDRARPHDGSLRGRRARVARRSLAGCQRRRGCGRTSKRS